MSSLLVIGGTGFFGKSILDSFKHGRLEKWGIEKVIAMSRNAESLHKEAPQLISSSVELYSGDITKTSTLPAADIVIHAAASTDAIRYLSSPLVEQRNIQVGTYNYCTLAKSFHPKSKILYVSSGAVYGKQPVTLSHIPEEYTGNDLSELPDGKRQYALAKRDAEEVVKTLGKEGLSVSIASCFAFVGPWLPRNQHFAIGNFIEDGLQGRPVTVKAKNKVYRTCMHADDLVEWLMTMAVHANPLCPIYNVGSDQAIIMGDLAKLVANEFGFDADVHQITDAAIDCYVPSIEKAIRELHLTLKYDVISSIRRTIQDINYILKNYSKDC